MGYSLGSGAGVGATNESVNQSRIDWSITLYVSSTAFQYYYEYGYLDVTHLGRVWAIDGRHENVYTGSNKTLASGSNWVTHSTTGTLANIYTSGYFRAGSSSNGYGGAYATGDLYSSSGPSGTSTFNVSPTTPSLRNGSRASTSYYLEYNGGVNNSGQNPTFTLQRADDLAFTQNVTPGGTSTTMNAWTGLSISGLSANATYYFRVKSTNDHSTVYSAVAGPYYGVPSAPTSVTPTQISTANDRISVAFAGPTYGGNLQSYNIVRNGTPSNSWTGVSITSPYIDKDSGLIPGNIYTYSVTAVGSAFTGTSATTSGNVTAPGTPYAPTAVPTISNVGLDVTVVSAAVSANGGVAINTANANEGYFVQYQLADTLTGTYGYGGTAGAWSPATKMSNQTTRTHTYSLMTPAKYYKFRTYGANTVTKASDNTTNIAYPHNNITYTSGVNFATNTTGYFLAAGGKRFDGTNWIPTQTAKRFDGTNWVPLTIAKRFDGTNWVPLS